MTTRVHKDEQAPRAERWRVLREHPTIDSRWITVESFPTSKQAFAFARGFTLGAAYEAQEARQ